MQALPNTSTVLMDFVMPNSKRDHFLAAVRLLVPLVAKASTFKRRQVMYNRANTRVGSMRAHFAEIIRNGPCIPFPVDPTSDGIIRDEFVEQAAIHAFGPPLQKPRQEYLSEETWSLVKQRKMVLQEMHHWGELIKYSLRKLTFLTWKRNKRAWGMHSVIGAFRPWLFRRRRMAENSEKRREQVIPLHWRIETQARTEHATRATKVAGTFTDTCNGIVEDVEDGTTQAASRTQELFKAAKKLLPQPPRAFRFITKEDGTHAVTQREVDETLVEHFSITFDGQRTTVGDIIEKSRSTLGTAIAKMKRILLDADLFASIPDLHSVPILTKQLEKPE